MTDALEEKSRRALRVVSDQLGEATRAAKCHSCGCLHQTVAALEATHAAAKELSAELSAARTVFAAKKYECLGCPVCYPAIAANAFTEAFPEAGEVMDLCPTEAPEERMGWPPLPGSYTVLRFHAAVAVCTLNSEHLVAALANDRPEGLAIVGTLNTENLGIERVIKNVLCNPNIRALVQCGDDTQQAVGHLPGQSLVSLLENGVDERGRIRGSRGKRPVMKNVTTAQIEAFRSQVRLVSLIGENDPKVISKAVVEAGHASPGAFGGAPKDVKMPVVGATEPQHLVPDPAGYLVVYPDVSRALLLVEHYTNAGVLDSVIEGHTATAVYSTIIERGLVSRLDHAAYLGRELARAHHTLRTGEPYVQDRAPGELELEPPASPPASSAPCGCSSAEPATSLSDDETTAPRKCGALTNEKR